MIDLTQKPFCLNKQQIQEVNAVLAAMTPDEKIGQLFCPIGSCVEEEDMRAFIEKYNPGALMYRPLESAKVKKSKIN